MVIPKEGRDVAKYRPISLLNLDIELFRKILGNHLLPFLPSLIANDQVSFVLGREARDNTTKALNIHLRLTSSKLCCFFLSLDVEKSFYRLAWDYMEAVLPSYRTPKPQV